MMKLYGWHPASHIRFPRIPEGSPMDTSQSYMTVGLPMQSKFTFTPNEHGMYSIEDSGERRFCIHLNSVVRELSTQSHQEIQKLVSRLAELLGLGNPIVSMTDGMLVLTWLSKKCEKMSVDGLGAYNES